MAKKVYKSLTGTTYTFPVSVKERVVWITIGGQLNRFVVDDDVLQNAIEAGSLFKRGSIGIAKQTNHKEKTPINVVGGSSGGDAEKDPSLRSPVAYPEVTDINGAVAVLRAAPYNVSRWSLKTPAAVREQAVLNAVSFPNWAEE